MKLGPELDNHSVIVTKTALTSLIHTPLLSPYVYLNSQDSSSRPGSSVEGIGVRCGCNVRRPSDLFEDPTQGTGFLR